jgi:hypothetical protein
MIVIAVVVFATMIAMLMRTRTESRIAGSAAGAFLVTLSFPSIDYSSEWTGTNIVMTMSNSAQ